MVTDYLPTTLHAYIGLNPQFAQTPRADGRTPPRRGDVIHLTIAGGHAHVFDPNTGFRIGN